MKFSLFFSLFFSLGMIFVIPVLFIGCAAQKPSDSEVKKLIREELQSGIPTDWIGSAVWKTESVNIEAVEIQEWGNFNKAQQYWPVKTRVAGSAEAFTVLGSAGIHDFDEVSDFKISKDDYGKWKILR